jgi:PAS domain S-box-containing protein
VHVSFLTGTKDNALGKDQNSPSHAEQINRVLFAIADAVNSTEDLRQLYSKIHHILGSIIDVTNFFIAIVDHSKKTLHFPYHVDTVDEDFSPLDDFDIESSLTGLVATGKKPVLLRREELRERAARNGTWGPPPLIWMGSPLLIREEVKGVIAMQSYTHADLYDETDLQLLTNVSQQIAVAIDRKRFLDKLTKSEEQYRELVENANSIVLRMDGTGRISFFNEFAQRFFGYDTNEIIGRNVVGTIIPETDLASKDLQSLILNIGLHPQRYATSENENICRDGRRVWISWTNKPVYSETGEVDEILCVGSDVTERLQTERELQESQERYSALFNRSLDWVYVADFEGHILDANQIALEALGYTHEELPALTFAQLLFENKLPLAAKTHEKIRTTGLMNKRHEYRVRHKNGGFLDIETQSSLILHEGKPSAVLSIARDITERKRAEEALRKSEKKFQDLFKNMLNGYYRSTHEGRYIEVNPAFVKMMGYDSKEELLEVDITKEVYVQASDRNKFLNMLHNSEFLDSSHYESYCLKTKDGRIIHIEDNARYIKDEQGNVIFHEGICRDITNRKLAEEIVIRERNFSDDIINSLPGVFYMFDGNGKLVRWNNKLIETTGYSAKELHGMNILDLFPQEQRDYINSRMQIVFTEGESFGEALLLSRSGGQIPYRLTGRLAILDGQQYFVGLGMDISESKRVEEEKAKLEFQLRQAQKMESVGRLAGGIAHDFNNMIGIIRGHADLALLTADENHPFHNHLSAIRYAAQRSVELTHELLAFARLQPISPKIIDLNTSVSASMHMLHRLIGENIELIWCPGAEVYPVKIDSSQFNQLIMNLCVNARDAIDGVGKIRIESRKVTVDEAYCSTNTYFLPGEYALLSVSDTGCGMDRETQVKIFEPFFTTKVVGKGTGLGLATVYGIIKQNDGFY